MGTILAPVGKTGATPSTKPAADSKARDKRAEVSGAGASTPSPAAVKLTFSYTHIVIDPSPAASTLEKALVDIDGDGRLDAIIGFSNPSNGGFSWYEQPHSGVLTDRWQPHTIIDAGKAYEDMIVFDVNHDGALDFIASHLGAVKWFENPRGHGKNPAADPWPVHVMGQSEGENNMALADIDGDGKLDVATNAFVYFQEGPDAWVPVGYKQESNGVALMDIGSGKGAINLVGMAPAPFPIVWMENPREHGGNARTDPWIPHTIGPGYDTKGTGAVFASADLNKDGRMDIISAQAEGDFEPPPGGLIWWEAPADRKNGAWTKHTIDATYTSAHKVVLADMDHDGSIDIVTAEQEQSAKDRISIFFGDGKGGFKEQVLANGSGHNGTVGDIDGDGDLDILNSGHGFFGSPHPIEIFINNRGAMTFPKQALGSASPAQTLTLTNESRGGGSGPTGSSKTSVRSTSSSSGGSLGSSGGGGLGGSGGVSLGGSGGGGALAFTSVKASGEFTQSNNCPATLAPSASCSIQVTFRPTATGSRTGQLTITNGASDSPQQIRLLGVGG